MKIKKGPWTITGSKIVYQNPWIIVREDKVITPNHQDSIFGVIIMKKGVSVLPLDDQENVYLTQEYHYAVEKVTIEAVSGGIDDGESKLDAAKRELKEETGLTANTWTSLANVDPFTAIVNSPNYLYLARNLSTGISNPEGTETIKVIKVPFSQAQVWAMNGKITHSATVALILKTALLLKK